MLCLPAVLCAERVGQMTKTYNDIDAVTRLLEEVSVSTGAERRGGEEEGEGRRRRRRSLAPSAPFQI